MVSPFLVYHGIRYMLSPCLTLQCIMAYVIWYHLCYLCSDHCIRYMVSPFLTLQCIIAYGIWYHLSFHGIRYMESPILSWHTVYGINFAVYHGIRYMVLTLQCIMAYGIWYQLCRVSWYTVYGITFPNFAVYHGYSIWYHLS
jgi:hypothetical protein